NATGVPCPTCAAPTTTFPIPHDPNVPAAQIPGVFTLYGGTITGVSAYTLTGSYAADSSTSISVTFTTTNATTVPAWGGHIATRLDWGVTNSAVAITGSPYHTRLIGFDGAGGNQDRALSADAVVFPASITILKQASPEGPTPFPFTSTIPGVTSFSLID